MRVKVIVLSVDMEMKSFLAKELAKHGYSTETAINCLFETAKCIDSNSKSVLILDSDTIMVNPEQLKGLTASKNLFVILVGIKNSAPFLFGGLNSALSKPDKNNSFGHRLFLRNILDRIEHFLRSHGSTSQADVASAAKFNEKVIAIAASTGGTEALHALLSSLPAKVPPILIVQHMPSLFTHQFAMRLSAASKFTVKEAALNDMAKPNLALVAPGNFHMKAVKRNTSLLVECFHGDKLHGVRPAADILFNSMAEFMGSNVIGVVLTGMGADGAKGLYKLKHKGAKIIAQDQATSVVYGMPKAAFSLGIVDFQLPLNKIADKIMELV